MLLKYTGVFLEGCSAEPVEVANCSAQGACWAIPGVWWGWRRLLEYTKGLCLSTARATDVTAGCWGAAGHAFCWILVFWGIPKEVGLEPGCLGIPTVHGVTGMEETCGLQAPW